MNGREMPPTWPAQESSDQIKRHSLHHLVYAAIVDAIHSGDLKPGDRLNEAAIARRLGVSRSPVREALVHLAHDGLIEQRPRRGAFVTEFSDTDVDEIREVRALVEGYAARIACQRIRGEDEERLRVLIEQMEESARTGAWIRTATLNARFHQTIVELADNGMLRRIWDTFDPLAWLAAAAVPPGGNHDPDDLRDRHEQLLVALVSGNPDQAEEGVRSHIVRSALPQTERTLERH